MVFAQGLIEGNEIGASTFFHLPENIGKSWKYSGKNKSLFFRKAVHTKLMHKFILTGFATRWLLTKSS